MALADERLAVVEEGLSAVVARLAAVEEMLSPERASGAVQFPGPTGGASFAEQLKGRLPSAENETDEGGIVAYAGAARTEEGELLWDFERGTSELLGLDLAPVAQILAALGHPVRLELVRTLLRGPKASQELQGELGLATSGPLYYHLKELTAAGIVTQPTRNAYRVEPRRVVPFLAILAAAIDVGGL